MVLTVCLSKSQFGRQCSLMQQSTERVFISSMLRSHKQEAFFLSVLSKCNCFNDDRTVPTKADSKSLTEEPLELTNIIKASIHCLICV